MTMATHRESPPAHLDTARTGRRILVGLVALAAVFASLGPASAQDSAKGLRIVGFEALPQPGTVRLQVRLEDPALEPKIGPQPASGDFTLQLQDGTAAVQRVQRLRDVGLRTDTLVAIDHSLSFKQYGFEEPAWALASHLGAAAGPNDSVGLLLFGYQKTEYPARTNGHDFAQDVTDARAKPWDKVTRLYTYLIEAIDRVAAENPDGPRQVVVMTDGDEESTTYDWKQIAQHAQDRRVWIQVVLFRPPAGHVSPTLLDNLRAMAEASGGSRFEFTDVESAKSTLDSWRSAIQSSLVLDASLQCLTKDKSENSIRVDYAPGGTRTAWSRDFAFRESPDPVFFQPCGSKGPECKAPEVLAPSGDHCVRPCTADGDCPSGQVCDAAACLPGSRPAPPAHPPDRRAWFIGGGIAGVLLLILLAWLLMRARNTSASVPAPPTPVEEAPAPPPPEPPPPPVVPAPEPLPDWPVTHLVVKGGDYDGRRYQVNKKNYRVGGDRTVKTNDAVFDLGTLSGSHAEFQIFPSGDMWVRDLESSNGTRVNNQTVPRGGKLRIRPGDQVQLGRELLFVVVRPGEEPPPADPERGPSAPPSAKPTGQDPAPQGAPPPRVRKRNPTVID